MSADSQSAPTLPSETELAQLPLQGLAAFASRCARRVRPRFQLPQGLPDAAKHASAVTGAIALAEAFARGEAVTSADAYKAAVAASEASGTAGKRSTGAQAALAAHAAAEAAYAVYAAASDLSSGNAIAAKAFIVAPKVGIDINETFSAVRGEHTVNFAARSAAFAAKANLASIQPTRHDYQSLLELRLGAYPEMGRPVDPGDAGPLGTLWLKATSTSDTVGQSDPLKDVIRNVFVLADGQRIEVEHGSFESYARAPDDTVILATCELSQQDCDDLLRKITQIDDLQSRAEPVSGLLERESLGERIASWPAEWGDYLRVSLFGAIDISSDLVWPELGIEISSKREEGTFAFQHFSTYPARVRVKSRDLEGVSDAIERLEDFLNAWHIAMCQSGSTPTFGAGCSIHYYCSLLTLPYAVVSELTEHERRIRSFLQGCDKHSKEDRQKIMRAAWWIRQARHDFLSGAPIASIFALYSAYWNAFECLVDVFCDLVPMPKLSKLEKTQMISEFFSGKSWPPGPQDIASCYKEIVDPGIRQKARHVFNQIADPKLGDRFYEECFTKQEGCYPLYQIRNDIDHGSIVEYDVESRWRVLNGLERLQAIVVPLFTSLTSG